MSEYSWWAVGGGCLMGGGDPEWNNPEADPDVLLNSMSPHNRARVEYLSLRHKRVVPPARKKTTEVEVKRIVVTRPI